MNFRSLRMRLLVSLVILLSLTFLVALRSWQQLSVLAELNQRLYRHPYTVSNTARDVKLHILDMSRTIRKLISAVTPATVSQTQIALAELDQKLGSDLALLSDRFLGDKAMLVAIADAFSTFQAIRSHEIELLSSGEITQATQMVDSKGSLQIDRLMDIIDGLIRFADDKALEFVTNASEVFSRESRGLLLMMIISLALGSLIAWLLIRNLSGPLKSLTHLALEVSKGVVVSPQPSLRKDELGRLNDSFNRILEGNTRLITQVKAIAAGDLSQDVLSRSDQDELGLALQRMTLALRQARADSQAQDFLKSGLNQLNELLGGQEDLSIIASRAISFLASYVQAQLGAFYIYKPDKGELRLHGSYALGKRKDIGGLIPLGEGLVGQAAFEKQIISVSNLPADYTRISSASGDTLPRDVLITPLLYQGQLMGVVELASVREFDEYITEFMRLINEPLAIAIETAQAHAKMAELLKKTTLQASQLQEQQEEMQQINEELQAQQEELRQSNDELQAQNEMLDKQKQFIQDKNSELEQTRQLIEEKAKALEETSRYKSEFLANMSHELRTPLNSILLLAKMLAENKNGELTAKQVEFSRTIHESGTELLKLINEILDLSKIEAGRMEVVVEEIEVSEMADSLKRLFAPLAQEKGLEFKIELADDLPATLGSDRQRLEQILKNLLSNAIKFTQSGEVALIMRRASSSECTQVGLTGENMLALVVKDSGEGIAQDKQKMVFEAFQQADGTTSRRFGGSGLGLTIARQLAHLLGGEILLQSALGQGSTFCLLLPEQFKGSASPAKSSPKLTDAKKTQTNTLAKGEKSDPQTEVDALPDDRKIIQAGDKSLLIIEDDPKFAVILADLARERGFKPILTASGENGLHLADFYKPSAIILDLGLPGMNGWQVLDRLKDNAQTRHIPVHIMSAQDKNLNALRMGAVGFLVKPITMPTLDSAFARIERIISKSLKTLLIVEDQAAQRLALNGLLSAADIHIMEAANGQEALNILQTRAIDCIILDIGLPDMSGLDLLKRIRDQETLATIPVIIYTGRELTPQEQVLIDQYAEKIIVKGTCSAEKLLDETTLFLHRVEADLPEDKRSIIRRQHDREAVFADRTVLLVDDDMRNVYALSSVLEEKGMKVIAARNGQEGLDKLNQAGIVDLVLMDIMMPGMDGYEAMREIRKLPRFKKLPIIALTAKAMKGDRAQCIQAGANDYLAKPVEIDKLFSMLRVWLYGSRQEKT